MKTSPTNQINLYLAGDINVAKQVLREDCMREGLCVTVTACDYIYTGGQEAGYCVGMVNYPRFPSKPAELLNRAIYLAELLAKRTCQWSALVVAPKKTYWINLRPE